MNHPTALCIFLLGLTAATANAQELSPATDTRAAELLKQVETNLASARTLAFDFSGTVLDKRPGRTPRVVFSGQARLMKPNFAWIEFEEISENQGESARSRWQIVSDGTNVWRIDLEKHQYRKQEAEPDGRNIPGAARLPIDGPLGAFFLSQIPHMTTTPTLEGNESHNDIPYQVVAFVEGDVNGDGVPLRRQRFHFGSNGAMRAVNEQLHAQFIAEGEFRNVVKGGPMTSLDFRYAPPASAQEATPTRPQMLNVGAMAPDFTVQSAAGEPIKLSDFQGKIVVLDFWATSCGFCLESRAHLNAVAGKFKDDVVFLAVHVWDKKADFDGWLSKHSAYDKLMFAIDERPTGQDVARTHYKAEGVPALFVIGNDGRITWTHLGYSGPNADLENAIKNASGTLR